MGFNSRALLVAWRDFISREGLPYPLLMDVFPNHFPIPIGLDNRHGMMALNKTLLLFSFTDTEEMFTNSPVHRKT